MCDRYANAISEGDRPMIGRYRRYAVIVLRLFPFAIAFLRDHRRFLLFGSPRTLPREAHRERANRLTERLIELGPAFIKAGQVLSTRPDVVPPVYADTLGTLQDEVPESETADPKSVLKEEIDTEFLDLDTLEPIAGGSLAYVYTAIRTDTGEQIALKVQRPDVKRRVERDLEIIRRLVPLASIVAPEHHQYSLQNIADDFEEIILQELDFDREARMMERIRDNLENSELIYVPEPDTDASTERVVVMEYVDGTKITEDDAFDGTEIDKATAASAIADMYLTMGLTHGVFHADPHPGNLAVDEHGRIVIYDFGMCQELTPTVQSQIVQLYKSLSIRDVDGLIDALVALDVVDPAVDRQEIRQVIELAIESLAGRPQITWRQIFSELTLSLRDFPFRIPPDVMLLIRVGTVAEGVCRTLDPEFDFLVAVRSYLVREGHAKTEVETLLADVRADFRRSLPVVAGLPHRLDSVLGQIERGELTVKRDSSQDPSVPAGIGHAVIAAGLFVTTGLLYSHTTRGTVLVTAAAILFVSLFLLSRRKGY